MDAETVTLEIGKRIRDLRKQNGLTQQELADRAELTKGFISQLERGQVTPSLPTLFDLVECLGSTPAEFFQSSGQEQIVYGEKDYFEKVDEQGNLDFDRISVGQIPHTPSRGISLSQTRSPSSVPSSVSYPLYPCVCTS